jgi:leucyl aminopeptidase
VAALIEEASDAVPIIALTAEGFEGWAASLSQAQRAWLQATGFKPKAGRHALLPAPDGGLAQIVAIVDPAEPVWALAGLPADLPDRTYRVSTDLDALLGPGGSDAASLGWALGTYAFTRYRAADRAPARLVWPEAADRRLVTALAEGLALARDLVNTPTEAMGPAELAAAAADLASRHGGTIEVVTGEELLAHNYPLIHAVGRAAASAPRLIDLRWGDESAPKVTLVGKGVCFDSGGLDIKSASGMKLMKKDMGGAATVLGLAQAIMATGLRLRLRVLVPAVENAIAGNAFRPMDVFRSRKGLTVEIGNTDAEGRLVLADALAEAASERPALLIDMATLTGAARVALGPDLPAMFARSDPTAEALLEAGRREADPLWRLPLWAPYRKLLDSKIADINNASDSSHAGAVTAALFLDEFVEPGIDWIHLDTFAWIPTAKPGRPEGGEGLGLRAIHRLLRNRFG